LSYSAPIKLMRAMLQHAADIETLSNLDAFAEFDTDLMDAVLDEAGKLARDIVAPTNQPAHEFGARLGDEGVTAAPMLKAGFEALRDGGWMSLSAQPEFGGQQLPRPLSLAFMEMLNGANTAFALAPILTLGAIDALQAHASDDLKQRFLPKMISGEWSGAMALTEPQAGSDVGALKTRAAPNDDGSYAITGQKIYITWGDHDHLDNVIHLVLARLPDAPQGSKGISLFAASKYHIEDDGTLAGRNSFKCIGLEKKLGIHASPTCVMEYDRARAHLIGEPHKGLAAMFTMMNAARLHIGVQGVGVSEAAAQSAIAYAAERRQFNTLLQDMPDIQRMIARIRATTLASRAICYATGFAADMAEYAADADTRKAAKQREDLLTPIAKAWSTDRSVEACSLAVQVHGGMGFMSETLACQLYQDIRITPIYEGTNGIQALDLIGRKLASDKGAGMAALLDDVRKTAERARTYGHAPFTRIAARLSAAADALSDATDWMLAAQRSDTARAQAGATAYLKLAGDVAGGYFLTRAALAMAADEADPTSGEVIATAAFFAEDILSTAPGQLASISCAADILTENADILSGKA